MNSLQLMMLLIFAVPSLVKADWPAHRHDAARSATGDGSSRMTQPVITWRHYLGGTLGSDQMLTFDVAGDPAEELLLLSGGKLVAKTANDLLVWQSPFLELLRISGITDLDGNGTQEVVVGGHDRVHVVNAADGKVLWSLPAGTIGALGAVRLADFNHDSHPDVYVADAACGSVGSLGDVAEVWSFATGADAPTRLFQLERRRRDYVCGLQDTVADVNGDGQLDIIAQGTNALYVYSGVDGALISTSTPVGSIPYGTALVEVANLDTDPAIELICYTDNSYSASVNSRRVFMMDWDSVDGRLAKRWERSVGDVVNDRHAFGVGGLGDVDGDHVLEVVTSFYQASVDKWTTVVLGAATGVERASITHGPFRGLVDLDGDGSAEVVAGERRAGVGVYRWNSGGLTPLFVANRFEPLTMRARDASAPSAAATALVALDLDRSGPADLIGLSYAADGVTPEALVAFSSPAGTLQETARLGLGGDTSILTAAVATLTGDRPQLVIARNDGFLWVLNSTLAPTNDSGGGLRLGGYYSGATGIGRVPLAADFDKDGASDVVAIDSRQVLVRLSTKGATLSKGPQVEMQIPGARLPLLADLDGDGVREILHWTTSNEAALRAVRARDGSRVWQRTLGAADVTPTNDLMAGDLNGDDRLDIVYSVFSASGGTLRINAVSGDSGARRWLTSFETLVAGSGLGVGSLFDRNGDGAVDVLAAPRNLLQWIDGRDGTAAQSVDADYADYGIVANLDADPAQEIVSSGALFGVTAYNLDLTAQWASRETRQSRLNGAVVACADGTTIYVSGHVASARFTAWNAASGAIAGDVALRAGRIWAPATSVPQGAGQLGNITVSPNLTGDGQPAALVPSTDGHLYAVDPCRMRLAWALNFGAPVGEALLADTDGDSEDEIVVTAADGFLYGVDQQVVPSPAYVYENDGQGPVTTAAQDVDTAIARDTLYANWASVSAASSYEYAILGDDGTFVTLPEFIDVGSSTQIAATGLALEPGHRYVFAVRARGPAGTSAEQLSDGVFVQRDPCIACGDGTTCVKGLCVAVGVAVTDAGMSDSGISSGRDAATPSDGLEACSVCGRGTRCVRGRCLGIRTAAQDAGAPQIIAASGGACATSGYGPAGIAELAVLIGLGALIRRRRSSPHT